MDQQEKKSIEEDIQSAKEKMNYNKEQEKRPIWKALIILAVIIAIIAGGVVFIKSLTQTKMQYTSIKYQLNKTYVYFSVENAEKTTINIEDFSIMVNGTPQKAESFEDNKTKLSINQSEQKFCVIFKFYDAQLDKPIRIFYKGKEIKFNKTTRLYL